MDTVNTDGKETVFVVYRRKQRSGPAPSLTVGKPYSVIDFKDEGRDEQVLITNDRGTNKWYYRHDFDAGPKVVAVYNPDSITVGISGNPQSSTIPVKSEPAPSDQYKYCNHHHELTEDYEIVNFGDGEFVANKAAVPLLKALNEAGLRTRSHHIEKLGEGWFTILLEENVDIEIKTVREIDADRYRYDGKVELLIRWEPKRPIN
ncbi:hypothetical protein [Paraflavitalea sp. CAU 1676]|uniref:hypothetical protein n=1 Tax=Paraflavitalea sp. CAU 1676 TaxID=3032598 RepID=UPI0023D9ED18|nr:hypothetical protein [Paraflavitalea sp. CAU 1676]MDF2189300.1 hypothetical protein [Paraflavitalea sp. CAU 1676]